MTTIETIAHEAAIDAAIMSLAWPHSRRLFVVAFDELATAAQREQFEIVKSVVRAALLRERRDRADEIVGPVLTVKTSKADLDP